jgi:hypothetical protein
MNAQEITRRKYADLMARIDELEERIAAQSGAPAELMRLQEELGAARTELARISGGCGTPHGKA